MAHRNIDFLKREIVKQQKVLQDLEEELERARLFEINSRQAQNTFAPPPSKPAGRDLVDPSQPAPPKRGKAINYKGLVGFPPPKAKAAESTTVKKESAPPAVTVKIDDRAVGERRPVAPPQIIDLTRDRSPPRRSRSKSSRKSPPKSRQKSPPKTRRASPPKTRRASPPTRRASPPTRRASPPKSRKRSLSRSLTPPLQQSPSSSLSFQAWQDPNSF